VDIASYRRILQADGNYPCLLHERKPSHSFAIGIETDYDDISRSTIRLQIK